MGDLRFSDATDPNQTLLFEAPATGAIAEELSIKFQNAGQIPVSNVLVHVEDDTAYLRKHMREALIQLEDEGRLHVAELKRDGKKRRDGTFPEDALVTFQ